MLQAQYSEQMVYVKVTVSNTTVIVLVSVYSKTIDKAVKYIMKDIFDLRVLLNATTMHKDDFYLASLSLNRFAHVNRVISRRVF